MVAETPEPRDGPAAPAEEPAFGPRDSLLLWVSGTWITEADWRARHRIVLWTLALHTPFLFLLGVFDGQDRIVSYATFEGFGVGHSLLEASVPAAFAALAAVPTLPRRVRSATACLGLIAASSILTHFSGGFIEAHFHFFVMVGLAALYVDWIPFAATMVFVLLHHGVVGTLAPESVFNHPAAIAHPWRWAAIHAFFIAAMGATQVGNLLLIGKRMQALALQRTLSERAKDLV